MPTLTDAWIENHRIEPDTLADAPRIGIGHVEAETASLAARPAETLDAPAATPISGNGRGTDDALQAPVLAGAH